MVMAQEYFGTTTFGDAGIENSFHSAVDSDGNIYTPGLYSGSITVGPDTINWAGGNADGFLAIHDSDGNPTGVLGFGGGFDDVVIDVAIADLFFNFAALVLALGINFTFSFLLAV